MTLDQLVRVLYASTNDAREVLSKIKDIATSNGDVVLTFYDGSKITIPSLKKLQDSIDIDGQTILNRLKEVDGAGSGLDADLVRGLPADFTGNLSGNGYQKLPSGLIIQWGTAMQDSTLKYAEVVFPISFPNEVLSAVGTHIGRGNAAVIEYIGYTTKSSMRFRVIDTSHRFGDWEFRWIAIGY